MANFLTKLFPIFFPSQSLCSASPSARSRPRTEMVRVAKTNHSRFLWTSGGRRRNKNEPKAAARKLPQLSFCSARPYIFSFFFFGSVFQFYTTVNLTVGFFSTSFPQPFSLARADSFSSTVHSPFKNEHNLSSYDNRISGSPFASPLEKRGSNLQSSSPFAGGSPGQSFGSSQGKPPFLVL